MKKVIVTCMALFAFAWAKADIIIEGTYSGNTVLFGTITIKCKNSQETCAKINTSGSSLSVYVPHATPETFTCSSYSVSGCDTCDIEVTFNDCEY